MENNSSKRMLLHSDELELPIDGSFRRKRRTGCVTITINTILCLLTCIATITCIVYCTWTLGEIQRAKTDVDASLDRSLKSPLHRKPQSSKLFMKQKEASLDNPNQNSDEHEDSMEETLADPGFEFEGLADSDENDLNNEETSVEDNTFYDEEMTNERTPVEHSFYDTEYELDTSSGDYSLEDEDVIAFRDRRSLPKTNNKKEEGDSNKKSKQRSKKPGRGKQCKGKGCRKEKKNRKSFSPLAAQYEATVSDDFITDNLAIYDKLQNTAECMYIAEMQGDLCRSKVFTPDDPAAPLNIFHPTSWVSDKKSPLRPTDGSSSFKVKSGGIMLVFAQVSFSTNRPTNGVSIVQNRESQGPAQQVVQELQCKQGIPDSDVYEENVNQSCSIVGLLRVEKDDSLEIYSNYKGSSLDLSEGSSYFGAVQLTKG